MDQKQTSFIQRIKGIKKEKLIHALIVVAIVCAVIGLVAVLLNNGIKLGGNL